MDSSADIFHQRRTLVRISIILVVVAALLFSSQLAFGRTPPHWLPTPVRDADFDLILFASPILKKLSSIASGSFFDDRVYFDNFGEMVKVENMGVTIIGSLYRPEGGSVKHPGILLMHGSTPEGRKLGLYRVLGKALAERGYIVLSIDLRGFGESDDPPRVDEVLAFDSRSDIVAAVSYLISLEDEDPSSLYIIGHSLSGAFAIAAAIDDPPIVKVVSIGPSRRTQERFNSNENSELPYAVRREQRYMNLREPIPIDIYNQVSQASDVERYADYLSRPDHKPVLFIDGQLESEADRQYLSDYISTLSGPIEYFTLPGGDHYANVANFGSLVIYDRKVVETLVGKIDRFLRTRP